MRADNSRLRGDLGKSRRIFSAHFARIAASARTAGQAISRSLTRIGLAVGAAGVFGITRFAQLERTMARVGAVTGAVGDDFRNLQAAAEKMGKTTEFTANQAAEAMEQLGLAGFKTDEIITALPGTLELATSAQIDIATASSIAAKTMKAFGFEAKDMTRINDTLVKAFTSSNTNILQLAEALKPVGPVAKTVGVSLEDTTAILAKVADAGFQGGLGGTSLRNALIRLAAPTPRATKLLQAFGVKGVDPLFTKLRKISKGMDEAATQNEKLAIATELFGLRGGPALIAALDVGVDKIEEFSQSLKDAGGITKRIAEANLNTLTGQFNILKSAIDAVFITTGRQLNPVFRKLIDELQKWTNLNADKIATALAEAMKTAAKVARELLVAIREMLPGLREVAKEFWGFLKPILAWLREHPKLMAALILLKVSGLAPLVPLLFNIGRGAVAAATGLATLSGLGAALALGIVAPLALAVIKLNQLVNAAKAAKKLAEEKQIVIKREFRGRLLEKAKKGGIGALEIESDRLERVRKEAALVLKGNKILLSRAKSNLAVTAKRAKLANIADALLDRIGIPDTFRSRVREARANVDTARKRLVELRLAMKRVAGEIERIEEVKRLAGIVPKIVGEPVGAKRPGGLRAPPLDPAFFAGLPGFDANGLPVGDAKRLKRFDAKAAGGAPPAAGPGPGASLLEPGRSGLRQFGMSIQDALLRTKDDTEKKLLISSQKQEKIQNSIVAAIKDQNPTAVLT